MKCWASSVSECCSTQSREHYITKGLFSDKTVKVVNAPFLGDGTKVLSKASLTRKCLCKKHNELLSSYDDEAIRFGKALEYALNLSLERRSSKQKKFSVHKKHIDREKLTRWFIKTFLGLHEFFKYPSASDQSELARLVYSKNEKAASSIQLGIEMKANEDFDIKQAVTIASLEQNGTTIGMVVELYGIRLQGLFKKESSVRSKPLKLKFHEHRQGLSCIIAIN
ncbi:hypothetical protein J8Z24_16255 [Pseudoalteromonas sp. SCSIO 43201]|uniref:hypothetical protein n=1 Tax=Pseudoalteromonas sp. SCSIO 43201 TaxID=2822842 RepID=UPI0020751A80|nr:hypothetical protein [Pseudoalteromonas sp. SCSIO 43201]USD28439.1 hypothetical protein J8Z24_16255 [Pseudoalteromonas sp. SCSIO 43201]